MGIAHDMLEKLKQVVADGNSKGVPIPTLRDPKTGVGSVSLTLVFLSFNLCLFGMIGKITKVIGEVDLTNALWLFGICTSLYFGRTIVKKADGGVAFSNEEVKSNEQK
jgi:hypothetical protein